MKSKARQNTRRHSDRSTSKQHKEHWTTKIIDRRFQENGAPKCYLNLLHRFHFDLHDAL